MVYNTLIHKQPMTSTIPACKNCKHLQECPDDIFSTCALYQYEIINYLNGTVTKQNFLAESVRGDERFCGKDGKNFEQREVPVDPVEVPRVSAGTRLKRLINGVWKYFSRYDTELI